MPEANRRLRPQRIDPLCGTGPLGPGSPPHRCSGDSLLRATAAWTPFRRIADGSLPAKRAIRLSRRSRYDELKSLPAKALPAFERRPPTPATLGNIPILRCRTNLHQTMHFFACRKELPGPGDSAGPGPGAYTPSLTITLWRFRASPTFWIKTAPPAAGRTPDAPARGGRT